MVKEDFDEKQDENVSHDDTMDERESDDAIARIARKEKKYKEQDSESVITAEEGTSDSSLEEMPPDEDTETKHSYDDEEPSDEEIEEAAAEMLDAVADEDEDEEDK